jgi:hypothetical protein
MNSGREQLPKAQQEDVSVGDLCKMPSTYSGIPDDYSDEQLTSQEASTSKPEWFVMNFPEDTFGPLVWSELRQLAKDGKISHNTRIKLGKDGDWTLAILVGGLFGGPDQTVLETPLSSRTIILTEQPQVKPLPSLRWLRNVVILTCVAGFIGLNYYLSRGEKDHKQGSARHAKNSSSQPLLAPKENERREEKERARERQEKEQQRIALQKQQEEEERAKEQQKQEEERIALQKQREKEARIARENEHERSVMVLWNKYRKKLLVVNGEVYPVKRPIAYWTIRTCRTIQVVDSRNAIVEVTTRTGRETWWLAEIDTRDMVDDQKYEFPYMLARLGTKRYTTVLGASRTVDLLVPKPFLKRGVSLKDFRTILEMGLIPGHPPRPEGDR